MEHISTKDIWGKLNWVIENIHGFLVHADSLSLLFIRESCHKSMSIDTFAFGMGSVDYLSKGIVSDWD